MLDLISAYGNDSANKFWEGNGVPSKLKPMSGMASSGSEITREARETFIRAKYESKEFCKYTHLDAEMQRGLASERSHLYGARLLSAVAMPGLSSTVELIAASTYRDVPVWWFYCSFFFSCCTLTTQARLDFTSLFPISHNHRNASCDAGTIDLTKYKDPSTGRGALYVATAAGQRLQAELLVHNGFTLSDSEKAQLEAIEDNTNCGGDQPLSLEREGHLDLQEHGKWSRCWFALKMGVLNYYVSQEAGVADTGCFLFRFFFLVMRVDVLCSLV